MKTPKPKHSVIGASSRYRWSRCSISVLLSEGLSNTSGLPAKEGSAAHELVGLAMERAFSKNVPTKEVIEKIVEALYVYTDYCESIKTPDTINHIEHSFDMSEKVYEGLYGTADFVCYNPKTQILHVVDYKHGENLVVEVENNLQLEYYALGALVTLGYPCRWVEMTIVQPRAYHPAGAVRHWRVPSLHFIDVQNSIVAEAKETKNKKAVAVVGDHCMFCKAKHQTCKVYEKKGMQTAKNDFVKMNKDGTTKKSVKAYTKQTSFYKDPKDEFQKVTNEKELDIASCSLFD